MQQLKHIIFQDLLNEPRIFHRIMLLAHIKYRINQQPIKSAQGGSVMGVFSTGCYYSLHLYKYVSINFDDLRIYAWRRFYKGIGMHSQIFTNLPLFYDDLWSTISILIKYR